MSDGVEQVKPSGEPEPNLSKDAMASVVVFLVALPLCMGIAIASGAPPALGLFTGIIGGFVVGFLGGSPMMVSGPAAGLTVLVYDVVHKHGLEALGPVVLLAGLIQLIAGFAKAGQWFRAVSPAVIYGMLAGIGVLIFGSQFHVMVDDSPRGKGWENLFSIPEAIYKGIFPLDGSQHHLAAAIGIVTIVTLVLWNNFKPKKLSVLPAPLIAVIVGSTATALLGYDIKFVSIPDDLFGEIVWPNLGLLGNPTLIAEGFAIAIIASAESLLCATATDQMHHGARTNYDRELGAQGVGNMACGLVGALPLTGVIVRSSANIEAGATTNRSAIIHAAWLLGLVALFPHLLELIPTSALAAILVFIGYKLVNPASIKKLHHYGWSEVGIYVATVVTIVATDLLTGVLTGLGLAALKLLICSNRLGVDVNDKADPIHVELKGAATFVVLPQLAKALEALPTDKHLEIDLDHLAYVDPACIDLIEDFKRRVEGKGGKLTICWETLQERYRSTDPTPPKAKSSTSSRTKAEGATTPSPSTVLHASAFAWPELRSRLQR